MAAKDSPAKGTGVHSPNEWESADLGSDDRKNKFLRLMGAKSDRKHTGKIVIGNSNESHSGASGDSQVIDRNLETEFKRGIKRAENFNRHQGLGSNSGFESSQFQANNFTSPQDLKNQYHSSFVPKQDP